MVAIKDIRKGFKTERKRIPEGTLKKPTPRTPRPNALPSSFVRPPSLTDLAEPVALLTSDGRELDLGLEFPDLPPPGEKLKLSPELEETLRQSDQEEREWLEMAIAVNVKELNERPGGRFPAVPHRSYTLGKSNPRVTLIARPWKRSERAKGPTPKFPYGKAGKVRLGLWPLRLSVSGLGDCATGKRKKRLGLVDITVLGFRDKLADIGATCDGTMVLPDIATHVRLRLNDPKATALITIEGKPPPSSLLPDAWIKRLNWTAPEPDDDN